MNARLPGLSFTVIPILTRRTFLRGLPQSRFFLTCTKEEMADDSIDAHQTAPVDDVAEPLLKRAKLSEAATSSDSVATSVPTDIDPDILKNLGMPHQPNREFLCD